MRRVHAPASIDWSSVIRTAYRIDAEDDAWLAALAHSLGPRLDRGMGLYGYCYHATHPHDFVPGPMQYFGCSDAVMEMAARSLNDTTPEVVARVLLRRTIGTASEALGRRRLSKRIQPFAVGNVADSVAINAVDVSGRGFLLVAPVDHVVSLGARERANLSRVAIHLAAANRLRAKLAALAPIDHADAVIEPRGRIAHAVGDASRLSKRAALRRAVLGIERTSTTRGGEDGLKLWRALVAGRWSIVDRFDSDGRRYYLAWRNDPALPPLRALSEREAQIACSASLGRANKLIAYEFGLATSTVAKHLASAEAKLGVSNRIELIELARALRAATIKEGQQ